MNEWKAASNALSHDRASGSELLTTAESTGHLQIVGVAVLFFVVLAWLLFSLLLRARSRKDTTSLPFHSSTSCASVSINPLHAEKSLNP